MTKQITVADRPPTSDSRGGKTPRTPGSRRTKDVPGRGRVRLWVALVACLVVAVVGAGEIARMISKGKEASQDGTAVVSGVQVHVGNVDWVNFDHEDTGGGIPMPPQMMPGMPEEGEGRLAIELTVESADNDARALDIEQEFFLGSSDGMEPIDLKADSFGEVGRVNPGEAVHGSLYFDLPAPQDGDKPPYFLEWRRGGETVRLAVEPGGEPPDHTQH